MQQFFWTQAEKTKVIKELVAKIKEDLRRDEKEGLSAGLVKGSQLSMLDIIFCKMQLDNSSRKRYCGRDSWHIEHGLHWSLPILKESGRTKLCRNIKRGNNKDFILPKGNNNLFNPFKQNLAL